MGSEREYLKPSDVATILDISTATVLRMFRTMTMPAIKIAGGQWRIKESEFRKWEKAQMK